MSNRRGVLLVLSGPSGAGKSTAISELLGKNSKVYFSISMTTRKPRAHEEHGREYFFAGRDEFEAMINSGGFLEYAEYVGNYYGTPAGPVEERLENGIDVLLDIDVQGAFKVKTAMPEAVLVFIMPPTIHELERRLLARGTESGEKINMRLETARKEMEQITEYDYLIINEHLERAVNELNSIIAAEKCKIPRALQIFGNGEMTYFISVNEQPLGED